MKSMPLSPAIAARQVEGASLPSGVTAPRPVTATLFTRASLDACPPVLAPRCELGVARALEAAPHRLVELVAVGANAGRSVGSREMPGGAGKEGEAVSATAALVEQILKGRRPDRE